MIQIKCDKCKKIIKKGSILIDAGYPNRYEFCNKCGQSLIRFLKKNKLYQERKI